MTTSIELSSGIVIDTEGGRAYVMAPQGGVSAISLQDGAKIWHSENADKPLLLKENLLLSQALPKDTGNGVAIRMLRIDDKGAVQSESTVPLPAGVQSSLAATTDRGFSVSAEPMDGEAVLRWEYRERPLRGLASGHDEMLPDEILPGMGPPTGALGAFPGATPAEAQDEETVIRGQVRLSPQDGTVRPMVEPTVERALPTVPQFSIRRPGAAGQPAEESTAPNPLQFQSADGMTWLESAPLEGEGIWTVYRWNLHNIGRTEVLGSVDLPVSFSPFVVSDGKLFVELQPYARLQDGELSEEPMQLRAYDLETGERLWSAEIRDIYAVPAPPP